MGDRPNLDDRPPDPGRPPTQGTRQEERSRSYGIASSLLKHITGNKQNYKNTQPTTADDTANSHDRQRLAPHPATHQGHTNPTTISPSATNQHNDQHNAPSTNTSPPQTLLHDGIATDMDIDDTNPGSTDISKNTSSPSTTTPRANWLPLRIEWNDASFKRKSIVTNPAIDLENDNANEEMHDHPIMLKLYDFHQIVVKHIPQLQMKTSRSEAAITNELCTEPQSINDVRKHFHYFYQHQVKRFGVTMFIGGENSITIDSLKQKLFTALRAKGIYIYHHRQAMNNIATSAVGWYQGPYPEAFDIATMEQELNDGMRKQYMDNTAEYQEWCASHPSHDIQTFDDQHDFPHISCFIAKPRWKEPKVERTLTTRAIAVKCPRKYRSFVNKLLTDMGTAAKDVTYVPYDMQYAGPLNVELYGKIVTMQQKVIRDHDHEILLGISTDNATAIKEKVLKVPGILGFYPTQHSLTQGRYSILTQKAMPQANLAIVDTIIRDVTKSQTERAYPLYRPGRIRKNEEKIKDTLQAAWTHKTIDVVLDAAAPAPNQWRTPLPNLQSRSTRQQQKKQSKIKWADDRSVVTTATLSSDNEQIDLLTKKVESLTKKVHALENENMVNRQKAKASTKTLDTTAATTKALQTKVTNMEKQISNVTTLAADAAANVTQLQDRVDSLTRMHQSMQTSLNMLDNKLTNHDKCFADINSQLEAQTKEITARMDKFFIALENVRPTQEVAVGDKRSRETSTITGPNESSSPMYSSPAHKRASPGTKSYRDAANFPISQLFHDTPSTPETPTITRDAEPTQTSPLTMTQQSVDLEEGSSKQFDTDDPSGCGMLE